MIDKFIELYSIFWDIVALSPVSWYLISTVWAPGARAGGQWPGRVSGRDWARAPGTPWPPPRSRPRLAGTAPCPHSTSASLHLHQSHALHILITYLFNREIVNILRLLWFKNKMLLNDLINLDVCNLENISWDYSLLPYIYQQIVYTLIIIMHSLPYFSNHEGLAGEIKTEKFPD